MWKLPVHTRTFLQSLSAYAGMFFVRDTITASSSHLSKLGYFSPQHYSLFVSCNYACQALSRIGAGILIDWTNEPKFIYMATAAVAIISIFADSFLIPNQYGTFSYNQTHLLF
jgi:sugar phosphate permease